MKNNQSGKVLFIAQAAMIAAIYVVLTLIGASFSYGEVQVRISEALTILPAFTPAAIPGVFFRMPHQQHPRRMHSSGYHLRKPCHTGRSSFHMDAEKQE